MGCVGLLQGTSIQSCNLGIAQVLVQLSAILAVCELLLQIPHHAFEILQHLAMQLSFFTSYSHLRHLFVPEALPFPVFFSKTMHQRLFLNRPIVSITRCTRTARQSRNSHHRSPQRFLAHWAPTTMLLGKATSITRHPSCS